MFASFSFDAQWSATIALYTISYKEVELTNAVNCSKMWTKLTKQVPCSTGGAAHIIPGPTLSSMIREQWKLDTTSTWIFCNIELGVPMGYEVIPHPTTVAFLLVYVSSAQIII